MQTVCPNINVNNKTGIVMAGLSKLFVGEVIEAGTYSFYMFLTSMSAKAVLEEWHDQGPIRPKHIREAYRILKEAGKIPYFKPDSPFS